MEINVNKFKELLLIENEKQNLISRRSSNEEADKHIADSLAVLPFIDLKDQGIVDIGSGAGFPAMVLAIACPNSSFTLVESDLKKSNFLQEVSMTMQVDNVIVVRERVEEMGQNPSCRESFDLCTSRAVASMNVMLEYGIPLLKPGGKMLLWKGINYQQEIDEAESALSLLHAKVEDIFFYTLLEERDRVIIVVKKEAATSEKYPRRIGIPSKRPL